MRSKALNSLFVALLLAASTAVLPPADAEQSATDPSEQPFVCDVGAVGTGSAEFVSTNGHLSLQLSIADSSAVEVGSSFSNVEGLPPNAVVIDFKGQANDTFGPYFILSYRLPSGKVAGRVIPFDQGTAVAGAPDGFTRISFSGQAMDLQPGTVMRAMEIMAIGENGGGYATIGDVTINGVSAVKLMHTQSSCEFVP